jgi:hypothetical protein
MADDTPIDEEYEQLKDKLSELENEDDNTTPEYTPPQAEQKDNIFRFFRHILDTYDTTRIARLRDNELGASRLGVRHWQEIATFSKAMNLDKVSDYCNARSQIISATSMSRDGFWAQLFVTQIKKEHKLGTQAPQKKGLFWRKKDENVPEQA